MQESFNRRLVFVGAILILLGGLVSFRLISIQFGINTAYFAETALTEYRYQVTVQPPRGELYDRGGVLLATNTVEYEIGMSPALIYDREGTAQKLAQITGKPYEELLADINSQLPYILIERPAPSAMGQALLAENLDGVAITPIMRRFYPHGSLASQALGFVSYEGIGYYGVEGYYDKILAGKAEVSDQSRIPFDFRDKSTPDRGATLTLTLDSEIQYLVETTLAQAISDTGSQGGSILVMNPRTGEIIALASYPSYDPNQFTTTDPKLFEDPVVARQYEPGSTFKVMTMAIALESGVVTPDSTYNDTGQLDAGGITVYNWDRRAHGVTSMTQLLAQSLNVGASTLSLATGPIKFYAGVDAFGFGRLTGVDLAAEAQGSIREPGSSEWHEADLVTNAFGQGMAATPLQLAVAIAAIANDGLIMQPHIVLRRVDPDGTITNYGATTLGRAISPETAHKLRQMMASANLSADSQALVPGYTIAGKTGTAEIPIPGGYEPDKTIASFVGFGPVDDPQFLVLVKLDRPSSSRWGSETAAPTFSKLVQRLVIYLGIPPDAIRLQANGG
jgi:cell division protein FtsI/penicillin-binding protein 2